ncbi:transporter substrate-binding domain-containing protein [Paracidovorax wautersii]|uniref:Amino acid ABC transporter substrate-binding protein, PAAT family n=1 Tax=Paracidovorax wautersii TaxID=1177982 RepID=A0A1I2ED87_9BURK|nr:transporter substrate-binding domain-containing protein [Paracidovorax wautersii]SFE90613.1 amino acid ABC transporter substrate-binding protein, PAAT family [Paracidovorax wautersii]
MIRRPRLLRSAAAVAVLLAFGAGVAHADLLKDIRDAKKIRIALDTGSPPYGFVDGAMKPVGSDVETAQLLAQDLGVAMEIVQTTSPNRIPFLQTGKADIVVASLSVTPEREKVIDFSVPYAQILAVVAAPKAMQIKGFEDLKGKRVATTRGSNNDKVVTTGAKDAQIVRFDDDATLVTAAVSGQADIIATSPAIVNTVLAKAPGKDLEQKFVMSTVPLGIGLRKNEPELKAWLNDWITRNTANGKLTAIYKKYHGN